MAPQKQDGFSGTNWFVDKGHASGEEDSLRREGCITEASFVLAWEQTIHPQKIPLQTIWSESVLCSSTQSLGEVCENNL